MDGPSGSAAPPVGGPGAPSGDSSVDAADPGGRNAGGGSAGLGVAGTLAEIVDLVADPLAAVCGRSAVDGAAVIATRVPAALTRFFGFEIPLGTDEPGCDLLVQIGEGPVARGLLARAGVRAVLADPWGALARLAAELAPGDTSKPILGDAWIEYDVASGDAALPSVFAGPVRTGAAAAVAVAEVLRGAPLTAPARRAFDALLGDEQVVRPGDGDTGETPRRVVAGQIGVMHGRPDSPVRLCLSRTTFAQTADVAASSGWPGDPGEVAAWAERLGAPGGPDGGYLDLDLDTVSAPGRPPEQVLRPGFGLEVFAPDGPAADRLLDRVTELGLCTPARREALSGWHGHRWDDGSSSWPEHLRAVATLSRGRTLPAVVRRVNHVKVTVRDGRATAKVYLSVLVTWARRSDDPPAGASSTGAS